MKRFALTLLATILSGGLLSAALPNGEEIEFRFEPSFRDGVSVWLARTADGKIYCSAYSLPVVVDGGTESHSKAPPRLLKEASVREQDFEALVAALESSELRAAAESDTRGLDGTGWTFRRKAGGRRVELRFWTPERGPASPALTLGRRFVTLAQIESPLPKEVLNSSSQTTPGR